MHKGSHRNMSHESFEKSKSSCDSFCHSEDGIELEDSSQKQACTKVVNSAFLHILNDELMAKFGCRELPIAAKCDKINLD